MREADRGVLQMRFGRVMRGWSVAGDGGGDVDDLTGDESAFVRGQEQTGRGDFVGAANPAQRRHQPDRFIGLRSSAALVAA